MTNFVARGCRQGKFGTKLGGTGEGVAVTPLWLDALCLMFTCADHLDLFLMKRKENSDLDQNWNNAFRVMKTNYGLNDEALGVFAINLRFNLDDIQTIATEALVGGGDDKKCDVLYVDKEREIAVIAQCYMSSRPRP